jgi:hypothetical protein
MQFYPLGKRFSNLAAQLAGGKAYFRVSGTTTAASVYADDALTEELAYPVVADAYGNFPEVVYLDPTVEYRLTVIASDGDLASPLSEADPINTPTASGGGVNGADIDENSIPGTALAPGAAVANIGYTPQEDFTALTTPERNALARGYTGTVFYYFGTTAPTGSVRCYGETIGSAASGATLASDDYQALFNLLWAWAAADSAILTSAGAGSTRGGTAAADWAANKRLTLPDLRGEFLRGIDGGRALDALNVIGHAMTEMVGPHDHTVKHATSPGSANDTTVNGGAMTDSVTGATVDWVVEVNSGTENRPRSVAFLPCVWI